MLQSMLNKFGTSNNFLHTFRCLLRCFQKRSDFCNNPLNLLFILLNPKRNLIDQENKYILLVKKCPLLK